MGYLRSFYSYHRGIRRKQPDTPLYSSKRNQSFEVGNRTLSEKYEEDSKTLKEITTNREELEKVAREKYFMKKENEDIFIFEEDLNNE